MASRDRTSEFLVARSSCGATDQHGHGADNVTTTRFKEQTVHAKQLIDRIADAQYVALNLKRNVEFDPQKVLADKVQVNDMLDTLERDIVRLCSDHISLSQSRTTNGGEEIVLRNMVYSSANKVLEVQRAMNALKSHLAVPTNAFDDSVDVAIAVEQDVQPTAPEAPKMMMMNPFEWTLEDHQKTVKIARTAHEANQLQIWLHSNLVRQGDTLDRITHAVDKIEHHVDAGVVDLENAENASHSGCRCFGSLFIALLVTFLVQLIVLIWRHS